MPRCSMPDRIVRHMDGEKIYSTREDHAAALDFHAEVRAISAASAKALEHKFHSALYMNGGVNIEEPYFTNAYVKPIANYIRLVRAASHHGVELTITRSSVRRKDTHFLRGRYATKFRRQDEVNMPWHDHSVALRARHNKNLRAIITEPYAGSRNVEYTAACDKFMLDYPEFMCYRLDAHDSLHFICDNICPTLWINKADEALWDKIVQTFMENRPC